MAKQCTAVEANKLLLPSPGQNQPPHHPPTASTARTTTSLSATKVSEYSCRAVTKIF